MEKEVVGRISFGNKGTFTGCVPDTLTPEQRLSVAKAIFGDDFEFKDGQAFKCPICGSQVQLKKKE